MIRKYARVDEGRVQEFFETDGDMTVMFPPSLIWVDVTEIPEIQLGWVAEEVDGEWNFHAFVPPPPTDMEILFRNATVQNNLIYEASMIMAPILVSLDLGAATDNKTVATKNWQTYYKELKAIDLHQLNVEWPVAPADD